MPNDDTFMPDDSLKGVQKNLVLKICFAHISTSIHRIFKTLVPTPDNIPLITCGKHKNFNYLMYEQKQAQNLCIAA